MAKPSLVPPGPADPGVAIESPVCAAELTAGLVAPVRVAVSQVVAEVLFGFAFGDPRMRDVAACVNCCRHQHRHGQEGKKSDSQLLHGSNLFRPVEKCQSPCSRAAM